jgi:predicted nuclease with TOPRIM domain
MIKEQLLEEIYLTAQKFNDRKFKVLQPWTHEHQVEYSKMSKEEIKTLEKEHEALDEQGKKLTAEIEKLGISFDEQLEYARNRGKKAVKL